jgi:hypothetical protein
VSDGLFETTLARLLKDGAFTIGEVVVARLGPETYRISPIGADPDAAAVRSACTPEAARFFARVDASGAYRPLKTAPNLATDWVLNLESLTDVRLALDHIYPAALGVWIAFGQGQIRPVPFNETAGRQTGMYRIVSSAPDELVNTVCGTTCSSEGGCIKTILWEIRAGLRPASQPPGKFDPSVDQRTGGARSIASVPLLCVEACNLFVATCRQKMREARDSGKGGE